MKIVGIGVIEEATMAYPDAKRSLNAWRLLVEKSDWIKPPDVKNQFGTADILKNKQVIFNIRGNNYRLLTKVDYQAKIVLIKRFGTHKEYDTWRLD